MFWIIKNDIEKEIVINENKFVKSEGWRAIHKK